MEKRIVIKGLLLAAALGAGAAWPSSFDDFFAAIKRDDAAAVQSLARRGFDLNTRNAAGEHPLYLALRDDAATVADFLVGQEKVNVNAVTDKGETPLMMAALKGRLVIARRLIERKAEVNKTGWTPLHYAATHAGTDSPAMVRLLLENHAYIDAESPNRSTPLMMAAQYGNPGVVKLLLEEGADPLLRNEKGLSAIDFAQRANRAESAEIIAAFVRAKQPRGRW
jgi:ankyrin repeat protein